MLFNNQSSLSILGSELKLKFMKKLILIGLLFLGFNSYAQTENNTYNVYDNKNGLPSIFPKEVIVEQPNGNYNVYETKNGLPNYTPTQIIVPTNNGNYNIYNTNNGLPTIVPSQTIRKE